MKIIILILSIGYLAVFDLNAKNQGLLTKQSLFEGEKLRSYWLYLPQAEVTTSKLPILFVLHGGGGNAKSVAKSTEFHKRAKSKNWIVVYPQVTRHRFKSNWNDGRVHTQDGKEQLSKVDDVKFVLSILNRLKKEYSMDAKRVYLMGISNGAYMAQKIAVESKGAFSAVAAVIGSMSESVAKNFNPSNKISMLMINVTKDPLVPFAGGMAKFGKHKLGLSIAIESVVDMWVKHNQLNPKPEISSLPNKDLYGHCQIEQQVYSSSQNSAEVILLKLQGTGHTIPGNKQYAPVKLIGHTCQDLNAYDYIVEFLEKHYK